MTTKGIYFNGKWYVDSDAQGADGADGSDGASAYEQAQAGGYTDTLAQFYTDLASVQGLDAAITAIVGS